MSLTVESAARKDRRTAGGVTMEHRHFAEIARIISLLDASNAGYTGSDVATHFAKHLSGTNGRFDTARFLRACD